MFNNTHFQNLVNDGEVEQVDAVSNSALGGSAGFNSAALDEFAGFNSAALDEFAGFNSAALDELVTV